MSIKINSKKFKEEIESIECASIKAKKIIEQLLKAVIKDSDDPEIPIEIDKDKFDMVTFELDCLESTINAILYVLYRASETDEES